MTRWILDVARLGVFCSLVLLTANAVLGEDGEAAQEKEKTYGLKITVENGELKVEQTGSHDMGQLPEQLHAHLEQVIQQLADGDAKIRINAKSLMKDADGKVRPLPIDQIIKAIGGELTIDSDIELGKTERGDVEMDVDVEVEEGAGKRRIVIEEIVAGDGVADVLQTAAGTLRGIFVSDVDAKVDEQDGKKKIIIRQVIGGDGKPAKILVEKIYGLEEGQPNIWVSSGDDGEEDVRVMVLREGNLARPDMPAATHRLGIAVAGTAGVLVADVGDDTAAAEAGLKPGDIILDVDGDSVSEIGALITRVNKAGQNDNRMRLRVVRGDKVLQLTAKPRRVEADDEDDDDEDEDDEDDEDDDDEDDEDEDEDEDGDDEDGEDHAHGDHQHHERDDAHHAREHAEHARALHDRARARADEARAQARQHVESAHRNMDRELHQMARQMEERTREIHRRGREEIDNLRKQIRELRDMVRDLAAEVKDGEKDGE